MAKTLAEMEALADKILAASTVGKLTMAIVMIQIGFADERAECVIQAALDDLRSTRLLGITRAPLISGKGKG
jgi:hypothetical protein